MAVPARASGSRDITRCSEPVPYIGTVPVHGSPGMRTRWAPHFGQSATTCHGSGLALSPVPVCPSHAPSRGCTSVLQNGQALGSSEGLLPCVPGGNRQPFSFPSRGMGASSLIHHTVQPGAGGDSTAGIVRRSVERRRRPREEDGSVRASGATRRGLEAPRLSSIRLCAVQDEGAARATAGRVRGGAPPRSSRSRPSYQPRYRVAGDPQFRSRLLLHLWTRPGV